MACDKSKLKTIDKNTKVIVIGLGASGRAAVRLLHSLGAKVKILDKNPDALTADFKLFIEEAHIPVLFGEHRAEDFLGADIIIPSPGAPINQIMPLLARTNPPEVISEVEFASRYITTEPIIAITGTSGKTTTTSLCSAMLEEQGFSVFTGGNIGTPLSEYILERERANKSVDIIVLELSSFQLQACHSLKPRVAMLLNLSENHLDHHHDMQEYIDAKMRMFRCQDESDLAVLGTQVLELAEKYNVQARKVVYSLHENRFNKSQLFGNHNKLNAEAAFKAVKEFGVSLANAEKALEKFKAIEHRLEKICEHKGIVFVNDSKATTVDALRVALTAFDKPIHLLVGGKFKGGDLAGLIPLLQEKVKSVCMFGASSEYFKKAWEGKIPLTYEKTLKEAMQTLYKKADNNDVILLSPATSSFDQYKNYCARGDDFRQIALEIKQA